MNTQYKCSCAYTTSYNAHLPFRRAVVEVRNTIMPFEGLNFAYANGTVLPDYTIRAEPRIRIGLIFIDYESIVLPLY